MICFLLSFPVFSSLIEDWFFLSEDSDNVGYRRRLMQCHKLHSKDGLGLYVVRSFTLLILLWTLEPSGIEESLRITVDYPSKSSVFYFRCTSLQQRQILPRWQYVYAYVPRHGMVLMFRP